MEEISMARVQANYSKKDGKLLNYKFIALLGRDENGKQIQITKRVDPEGMTPAKEKKSMQRKADEWEEEQRKEYEKKKDQFLQEKRSDKAKITLHDFVDKYWLKKHVKNGKHTPDTVAFYSSMAQDIKNYLKDNKPSLKLSAVDKADVLDYLSYLRNEAETKKGTPYGATTIQHHFSTLRNVLEYAVYIEYIPENPCKKIKPEDRPRREQKEIDFMDSDEAISFLSCLDSEEEKKYWEKNHGSHLFWKCLCNSLILTGLRRGELVGLQWGDIDSKNLVINIRRNITLDTSNKSETEAETKIHIGEPKGKESRTVPISKYLLDLMTDYKAEQEKKYGGALLPNAYIFCRTDNAYLPIYPTEPTRMMKKFIRRHKLPDMSPHDLRHTAASLAIESGASVKEIQALLGHKDPAVTLKFYAGISEKKRKDTVDGIENLLRPKKEKEQKTV